MLDEVIESAKHRMDSAIEHLREELVHIRTGRATPTLVDRIQVIYYDMPTPLNQLASISAPDPRQLMIKPFDSSTLKDIERAILSSDLGLTPNNDGRVIRLNLPPLTEDRRKELIKQVQKRLEDTRVAVRNVRRDAMQDLRELEKEKLISEDDHTRGDKELQTLTNKAIERIAEVGKAKEEEIMTI